MSSAPMNSPRPCPFCGQIPSQREELDVDGTRMVFVICNNQKCPREEDHEFFIDEWNRRPLEDCMREECLGWRNRVDRMETEIDLALELVRRVLNADIPAAIEEDLVSADALLARYMPVEKETTTNPKIIRRSDLDPYAFRLLQHIENVCIDNDGRCCQTTQELSDICHMSTGKISNSKKILVLNGFITIKKLLNSLGGRGLHVITVEWISDKNYDVRPGEGPTEGEK
jgi:hypothetical protein